MKKLPLILSSLSLVAVTALYVIYFTSGKKNSDVNTSSGSLKASDLKIAYFLTDSLILNYQLALDLNRDFVAKQQAYNSEFGQKKKALEQQAAEFQEKVKRGGFLSEERAVQERDRLMGQSEEIQRLDYELSQKLQQMEAAINKQITDSILNYVKEYNVAKNYSLIFSNTGNIVYGSEQHNITKEILIGLNAKYNKK